MKHRHILTFFVAFLFMTIVPDSDAALVKRPEKGRTVPGICGVRAKP